jgi:hypothetical protein
MAERDGKPETLLDSVLFRVKAAFGKKVLRLERAPEEHTASSRTNLKAKSRQLCAACLLRIQALSCRMPVHFTLPLEFCLPNSRYTKLRWQWITKWHVVRLKCGARHAAQMVYASMAEG